MPTPQCSKGRAMRRFRSPMMGVVCLIVATTALANPPSGEPQAEQAAPPTRGLVGHWTFDASDGNTVDDVSGGAHHGTIHGRADFAPGAKGKSFRCDGIDDYVEVPDTERFGFSRASFSVAAWINVYQLGAGQQMIVAKNCYARSQREWGLMVDRDNKIAFYLHRGDWKTLSSATIPKPGAWHHVAATVDEGEARLYVNGKLEASGTLGAPIADTPAPLCIGGLNNAGSPVQLFFGAIDEVSVYDRALSDDEVRGMVFEVTDTHPVPTPVFERYPLWEGGDVPTAAETPLLENVRFTVVKNREPDQDGYDWLHGAAIIRHKDTWFVCWGNNRGRENTVTEVNRGRRSTDDCLTWSEVEMIGPGVGPPDARTEAHSHGVFLSREGVLWAFLARFGQGEGRFAGLSMEAFTLDEKADRWESRGIVAKGIWPLRKPEKIDDGNWFVPGCDEDWHAAVAISHGDDLTRWDTIKIPVRGRIYTEASAWIDGSDVLLVMRNHSPRDPGFNCAAVSVSRDFGRTWSPARESNLLMTTSKPYCGVLSTAQRYLIANTVRDHGGRRWPLTIAVGRPGAKTLSRVWRIRDGLRPGEEGTRNRNLAYPHAVEHDGKLYVVYSVGFGANLNHCELAVIPISSLAVE